LPSIEDVSFTLYTSKLSLDRKHSFIGVAKGLHGKGTLGLAWINAGVDDIAGWDNAGNATESFDYSSNAVALSYGFDAGKLNVGAGAKIIVNNKFTAANLDDASGGFGGLDLGVMYSEFEDTLTVGAAAKNLLGDAPTSLDLGVAFHLLQGNKATLSFDLGTEFSKIVESTTSVRLGVEYWLGKALALRAGGTHTGDRRSLYGGFGVKVAGLQFDYAYSPEDDVVNRIGGSTHFMSLSYTY
jgi:hypothetical protein